MGITRQSSAGRIQIILSLDDLRAPYSFPRIIVFVRRDVFHRTSTQPLPVAGCYWRICFHAPIAEVAHLEEQSNFSQRVVLNAKYSSYFVRRFIRHWRVTACQIVFRTNRFNNSAGPFPVRETIRCVFIHRYVRFPVILKRKLQRQFNSSK